MSSKYLFQVKKYLKSSCSYCVQHPIRLPEPIFSSLSFLPLAPNCDTFVAFDNLFGTDPDEKDCPSLRQRIDGEETEQHKCLMVSAKVRLVILCCDCQMPRCIYAKTKLKENEESAVQEIIDSQLYTCGSSLFPPYSPFMTP